jgi:uncharacterized protein
MSALLGLAAALLLQAATPQRPDPAPDKLRWVPDPTLTTRGWVSDPAGHLGAGTKARIDSVIFALERETSAEMAVVVIDSLDGLEPGDAALLLHRRWGVGKRDRNNGVVFLWSPALRKTYVSVGYRLEGVMTDARVGRIQDELVIPAFRRGDFDGGVLAGVVALAAAARGDTAWTNSDAAPAYQPPPAAGDESASEAGDERDPGDVPAPLWWVFGGVASVAGAGTIALRRRHRAPTCPNGHGAMTRLDEVRDDAHLSSEERVEERVKSIDYDVWTCAQCDAVVVRPWKRWFSGHGKCAHCGRLTSKSTSRTLLPATQASEGLVEVTARCANCGATDVNRHTTPRLPTPSSSSSGGSSFGGGSSGGGSSFGGGSAGGGGAGRSY